MKKAFFAISLLGMAMAAHAVTLSESFDDLGAGGDQDDLSALVGRGWYEQNNSTNAAVFGPYANGVSDTFASHSGAGYVSSNYMVGDGTISAWLVTPEVTLRNGSTFSFWTRTPSGSTYQDSLELRLSTSGSSTNVGSTATSVGDFSTLLTAVNPSLNGNYPTGWTQYTVTVNSLAPNVNVQGRFGFRYYVTNAGITGVNGNYIGIDDVAYTQVVPEPASLAALGLGAMALLRRRRRA